MRDFKTSDPSLYTMDHPDFIACSYVEKAIGLKKVSHMLFR